jgi:hypothetical protein
MNIKAPEIELQPYNNIVASPLPLKPKKRAKRKLLSSFTNFLSNKFTTTTDFVTSYDLYGQPISLHYQGEDTFKTFAGGFLSMVVLLAFYSYSILKCK